MAMPEFKNHTHPRADAIQDTSLRASLGTPRMHGVSSNKKNTQKMVMKASWFSKLDSPDPSVVQRQWNRMASKFSDLAFCFKTWIAMTSQTAGIWGLLVAVSQSQIADGPLAPTNPARQRFTSAFAWDLSWHVCMSESKGFTWRCLKICPNHELKTPIPTISWFIPTTRWPTILKNRGLLDNLGSSSWDQESTRTKYHSFDLYMYMYIYIYIDIYRYIDNFNLHFTGSQGAISGELQAKRSQEELSLAMECK